MATDTNPTGGCVTGLRLRLTSQELKGHLTTRAEYHARRADEKRAVLPALEEVTAKLKQTGSAASVGQFGKLSASNYHHNAADDIESLKTDIETHHNKGLAFAYLADHLFTDDYCLDRSDLMQLEILK